MHLAWPMLVALAAVGASAGMLGAMVGIGGGVLLVPALSLVFGIELKVAIATSLVCVAATSTAAGSVYVGQGLANMRLGMTLETTTTVGGILGGMLAVHVAQDDLAMIFGVLMIVVASLMLRTKRDRHRRSTAPLVERTTSHGWEERGKLAGAYFDEREGATVHYEPVRVGAGALVALSAGMLSGMLGVGGGFLKVPAMNLMMRVPLRVAAATSNVMIGVTALASLAVYLARGYVHPTLAAPAALGVVAGSLAGTSLSGRVPLLALRIVLAGVLGIVAVEMILRSRGIRVV